MPRITADVDLTGLSSGRVRKTEDGKYFVFLFSEGITLIFNKEDIATLEEIVIVADMSKGHSVAF